MTPTDRELMSNILIYGAATLAVTLGCAGLYLATAGVAMLPIYWAMLGLGALSVAAVGAAGVILGTGAGASPRGLRLTVTPVRLAYAAVIGAFLVGSGGAIAAGLEDLVWLWVSIGLAAACAGAIFMAADRTREGA
jgi:hypothetical protein